ncbi:MAG TPA: hypothetical protein ENN17_01270 [bacterium]|nr:hypothetical protein [bacterium]
MKRFVWILIGTALLGSVLCTRDRGREEKPSRMTVQIRLTLKGPAYQGDYYPAFLTVPTDYALWIEDADRNFVKTLKISPVAVTVDSVQGAHIDHLPAWGEASGWTYADLQGETAAGVAPSFDGLTGASPDFGADPSEQTISATWDLMDGDGNSVPAGVYYCFAEAANILKDGDFETRTETAFAILSETIHILLDIGKGTFEIGPVTENLTGMEAVFITEPSESIGKTLTGIDS